MSFVYGKITNCAVFTESMHIICAVCFQQLISVISLLILSLF